MYCVLINDKTRFNFDSFESAKKFFLGLPNIFKAGLYDSFGNLINKNYDFLYEV